MEMPLPAHDDKNFAKVLAIKQAVSQGILTASVRVRQDQLRPQQADHMAEVLRRVKARKAGLPEEVQRPAGRLDQRDEAAEQAQRDEDALAESAAEVDDILAGFL